VTFPWQGNLVKELKLVAEDLGWGFIEDLETAENPFVAAVRRLNGTSVMV